MTTNPRPPMPIVRKATLLYFVFAMYACTTGGPLPGRASQQPWHDPAALRYKLLDWLS